MHSIQSTIRRSALGIGLALLTCAGFAIAANAQRPLLNWPLDCQLGEDCWIIHHPDTDPKAGAQDFRCGSLAYDNHKGTDIALRDRAAMFHPVPELAAAGGTVLGTRDTAPDHLGDDESINEAIEKGEECGNGLALDHGNGWITQYCHMKSGSLSVARGMQVATGDTLGHVGQSGAAQFPHLHFSVRRESTEIDPFTAVPLGSGCDVEVEDTLWAEPVLEDLPKNDLPILTAVGFRQATPLYDALLQDTRSPTEIPVQAQALVLWAMMYGLQKGDKLTFEIVDSDGKTVQTQIFEQPKDQIRRMQFTGRRNSGWMRPGRYTGTARIEREGPDGKSMTVERSVAVQLTP